MYTCKYVYLLYSGAKAVGKTHFLELSSLVHSIHTKCVLPTAFAPLRFTLHQRNTSKPNVSPPPRHCVCTNPKQAQGPLRSHNIFFPKKFLIFPFIILTYFIQIWTKILKFFNQVVKDVIILLILLHTFLGNQYL